MHAIVIERLLEILPHLTHVWRWPEENCEREVTVVVNTKQEDNTIKVRGQRNTETSAVTRCVKTSHKIFKSNSQYISDHFSSHLDRLRFI